MGESRRNSRQLGAEDLLDGDGLLEAVVKDYAEDDAEEGSGFIQLLASLSS